MSTQIQRIRTHLKSGKSLTPLQALGLYGTLRLAHHVWVLREKDGMNITTRLCTDVNGHEYAEYFYNPPLVCPTPTTPPRFYVGILGFCRDTSPQPAMMA